MSQSDISSVSSDINSDYEQEILNARYSDMLHDKERNSKYYLAIHKVLRQKLLKSVKKEDLMFDLTVDLDDDIEMTTENHEESEIEKTNKSAIHVLDIGTGTGLLAMMAAKAGADRVTACETFRPMIECAQEIIEANNLQNKIKLVAKHSRNLDLDLDMGGQRANILVAELLDTELIGEGALMVYNDAHLRLLTDDVVCIPHKAICYAQVVQSTLAKKWYTMKAVTDDDGNVILRPPNSVENCRGLANLHSMQMSQLPLETFLPLTDPIPIMEFNFGDKTSRPLKRFIEIPVSANKSGSTDLVFYWWAIIMDREGEIVLSCAPYWAHPDYNLALKRRQAKVLKENEFDWKDVLPWRDHWLQAVYYIHKPVMLIGDEPNERKFTLLCNHDAYSIWFGIKLPDTGADSNIPSTSAQMEQLTHDQIRARPSCTCSFHMAFSLTVAGSLNQSTYVKKYLHFLKNVKISKDPYILILGAGFLLGPILATFGVGKAWIYETSVYSQQFLESICMENKLTNITMINNLEQISAEDRSKITFVIAEPHFLFGMTPWGHFYGGPALIYLAEHFDYIQFSPRRAKIYAIPVMFQDLHKIRLPVNKCERFDMTPLDRMIKRVIQKQKGNIETHPLWEYPCIALAESSECILEVDCEDFCSLSENHGFFINTTDSFNLNLCNGVCMWIDWHLDENDKYIISTGPTGAIKIGSLLEWDMFTKQGVCFIEQSESDLAKGVERITWLTHTDFKVGINAEFDVIYHNKKT